MTGVRDLGKASGQHATHHDGRIAGPKLKPGTEARLVVVRGIGGELDAQVPAAGKPDHQHRLGHPRMTDLGHRAAEYGLETPPQLLPPVRPEKICALLPSAVTIPLQGRRCRPSRCGPGTRPAGRSAARPRVLAAAARTGSVLGERRQAHDG